MLGHWSVLAKWSSPESCWDWCCGSMTRSDCGISAWAPWPSSDSSPRNLGLGGTGASLPLMMTMLSRNLRARTKSQSTFFVLILRNPSMSFASIWSRTWASVASALVKASSRSKSSHAKVICSNRISRSVHIGWVSCSDVGSGSLHNNCPSLILHSTRLKSYQTPFSPKTLSRATICVCNPVGSSVESS